MDLISVVEEQYRSEVKLGYQRSISKYDSLVTVENNVIGDSCYFNYSSAGGEAQSKALFGKIPRIGGGLSRVKCSLTTEYAGDELDEQQLSKTHVDGTLVMTVNTLAAINRKRDAKILAAMGTTSNTIAHGGVGMTIAKAEQIWQTMTDNLVFENGETPVVTVSTKQWVNLLAIDDFANSLYIGPGDMPFIQTKAQSGRLWLDMVWRVDPKLPISGSTRSCYAHVPSAVGLGLASDRKSKITETPDDTYLYYTREKSGAVLIDSKGCIQVNCTET